MPGKFERSGSGRRFPLVPLLAALLVLGVLVAGYFLLPFLSAGTAQEDPHLDNTVSTPPPTTEEASSAATTEATQPPAQETTEETEPLPFVVASATSVSTGDILMHKSVIDTGLQKDGSYDFSSIFSYICPYTQSADYMVGNLETTLCGTDNGYAYSGYPRFNCPDAIIDAAVDAGFDMILTANNHCYDTGTVGLLRTLETIEARDLPALGTRTSVDAPQYLVVDVNGIQVGMICYTYGGISKSGTASVNGISTTADANGLINVFDYTRLDSFYEELQSHLDAMRSEGAEAIMLYIHWGNEYVLSPNSWQTSIAQTLCDMGVDVIVGGHPHVVEPMALLTSTTDESHKTVCLYSMGNAVSNQRLGNVSASKTAHTEDGVLFSVTFCRYQDGTVGLDSTELIPCWVNMHTTDGVKSYNILPLDSSTQEKWTELYGLSAATYTAAVNSYERTMALVGEGLAECQAYLADARTQREAAYEASRTSESYQN